MIDNRGQALQVGAVLLLGILVVLIAVWQATVIPEQNEQVEFEHNQQVQSEMVDLRGELLSAADGSTPSSSPVRLGTDFPSRLLFVNPSSATGNLQTEAVGDGAITIDNAQAVDDSVSHFWDGSERTYESDSLRYSPDYRVFNGAPETMFDNSVVYNTFENEDTTLAVSQQSLINSDRITLLALEGDYFETGVRSESPDIEPVSTGSQTVDIEPADDDPITIEIPTRLSHEEWEELVAGEDVEVEDNGDNSIILELTGDEYELNMAKLGIGPAVESTDPAYITEVAGGDETAFVDEPHTITVEVRDEFNVPQSGIDLDVSVDGEDSGTVATGPDGQASYEVTANPGDDELEVEFSAVDYEDVEDITVDVTVSQRDTDDIDLGDPGGLPGLNPDPNFGTTYITESPSIGGKGNVQGVEVTFANSHDVSMNLHALRISFYGVDQPNNDVPPSPITYSYEGSSTEFTIPSEFKTEDDHNFHGPTVDPYTGSNPTPDETETIDFNFPKKNDAKFGDLMMIHAIWEEEGNPDVRKDESYFFIIGEADQ